jgi:hypothetical protein
MHLSFESLVITHAPNLHASLMDVHHNTSLRSILEDDSISSTCRTHIHFFSNKWARLWWVVRPSICSFHIAHFTFSSVLRFHLGLIHLLTPSLLTLWMWTRFGCIWHALNSLPVWRLMDNHTWCHPRCHVCPRSKKWARYMERVMVCPYVRSFIMNWFLHDSRGPNLCWWCGGYGFDTRDNGFKCH